jgi:hypothetical protein
LVSRPPANPVSLPLDPITRWHGMMMETGFRPMAARTARAASGRPIMPGYLSIARGLAEGNSRQRPPDFPLKISAGEIELQGKFLEFAREVIVELAFRFAKHRMIFVFHQRCEPDSFRIVVFPQDRG